MRRIIARAASAAPPPLFSSPTRARAHACASFSTVRMPLPSGRPSRHGEVHQGARALARDDLEMKGLAADDAAERHRRIVGRAGRRGRIEGDGERRRDFEGARHGQDVDARLGRPATASLAPRRSASAMSW